jgi:hypothetical protein
MLREKQTQVLRCDTPRARDGPKSPSDEDLSVEKL